jgi:hypothetical protein
MDIPGQVQNHSISAIRRMSRRNHNVRDLEVEHDVVVGHFQNLETQRVLHNRRMESCNSSAPGAGNFTDDIRKAKKPNQKSEEKSLRVTYREQYFLTFPSTRTY